MSKFLTVGIIQAYTDPAPDVTLDSIGAQGEIGMGGIWTSNNITVSGINVPVNVYATMSTGDDFVLLYVKNGSPWTSFNQNQNIQVVNNDVMVFQVQYAGSWSSTLTLYNDSDSDAVWGSRSITMYLAEPE